jgi:hypothetical protein
MGSYLLKPRLILNSVVCDDVGSKRVLWIKEFLTSLSGFSSFS